MYVTYIYDFKDCFDLNIFFAFFLDDVFRHFFLFIRQNKPSRVFVVVLFYNNVNLVVSAGPQGQALV